MTFTSIVIATYNGIEWTRRCVDSVIRHTSEPYEFVFVDNGSSDGTQQYLEEIPGATVIRNESNRGFAAACNQGMTAASGTHIVLLNNDTIVTPAWLKTLLACMDRDPSIGIVGPVSNNVAPIQRVHAPVTPATLDPFAEQWRMIHANAGFYAHRLIGYCMLFRRELLDAIGGMDERFFPGNYEDDDFSIRARISGKRLWVARDAFIYHEGSGTFKANGLESRIQSVRNAEKFRAKWSIAASPFEIDQLGYNPSDVVSREPFFMPDRHYIPLANEKKASD
ncbi:glycosyltransferase family 2 protein [Cohnella sp. GCM10027633]|uniref:glycosyltransferase family 2 protein n=1 Tax=unclassified Cohnella TaxID=2636738 RepID=UPI0036303209